MSFIEDLKQRGACWPAVAWVRQNDIDSPAEAWNRLHRPDWMIWLLGQYLPGKDFSKPLCRYAIRCVRETPLPDGRTVWDLLDDIRSRFSVMVAEKYLEGNATEAELEEAWVAAVAAEDRSGLLLATEKASWAAAKAARSVALMDEVAAEDAGGGAADAVDAWADAEAGASEAALARQAELLRECIPKNPFEGE